MSHQEEILPFDNRRMASRSQPITYAIPFLVSPQGTQATATQTCIYSKCMLQTRQNGQLAVTLPKIYGDVCKILNQRTTP